MRNDELYIDGHLVDMDDDTKVTLNYKSNIFTDLSKIVSNNSYTIKLPNTVHNQCVIDHADLPTRVTEFPRIRHAARYIRNGVEVINKANAVLMSVTSTFDVALSWGNATAFNSLVQDGKSLDELADKNEYLLWDVNLEVSNYGIESGILVSEMDLGLKANEPLATLHPSVRASYVLKLIQDTYNLKIILGDEKKEFLSKLIVPLLTRNGGYANQIDTQGVLQVAYTLAGWLAWNVKQTNANFNTSFYYSLGSNGDFVSVKALVDGTVVIRPDFKSKYGDISVFSGQKDSKQNQKYLQYVKVEGEYPYHYNIPFELEISKDDYFSVGSMQAYAFISMTDTHLLSFGMEPREVQIGDRFSIVENLPKMKTIDFIKAIASILGVFAVPAADNSEQIRFVSIDDVIGNIPIAVDWTRKVVASYKDNKPGEITFTLDGFAQNNRMNWKSDNTANYNGVLIVEDKTIDYERDAVTMPFAGTDMRASFAYIPIYSYNASSELEYTSVEPRILIEQNNNGKSKAVFHGLDWQNLLSQHYASYQKIIRRPVIIKEKIELREIELKRLDMTIPVYLAQYGKYYAIISVKAENTGICECQLLQL